jgi:type I restriction enzyme M protein
LTHSKSGGKFRKCKGETLFIDGRKLGILIDRVHRDLTEVEITRIAQTYHNWRGTGKEKYEDIPGFCKSANYEEIKGNSYVLTPGRYVGAEEIADDDQPFAEKMEQLTQKLMEQFSKSRCLEEEIKENLKMLGGFNI